MLVAVTQRDQRVFNAAFLREFLGATSEHEKRFAARFFAHVDIAPTHRFANPGAERFRDRFFRRETRGQMSRRKFHRHRIFDFAGRKNTIQKAIAETLD